MEYEESLLDTIFNDESVENVQDIEMFDVEEGELVEHTSKTEVGQSCDVGDNQVANQESKGKNSRHKKKKRKNKRKKGSSGDPDVTNINRFVLDACKRLRERKSYLMWTAVGCLGVGALSDLVKEVLAIQACGGQKTADGRRFRNGGGILWNIIKARDPNAYKEIMRKGKEFEKQFKQQQLDQKQELKQLADPSSQGITSDGLELTSHDQSQLEQPTDGKKRAPVHDRLRMPVTYDDLVVGDDPKDDLP